MSVFYRLYQNNNPKSAQYQKWYGRAVNIGDVSTAQLAEEIQANCTVKKSDVVAVISELVEVMTKHLQASHRVVLDGFGSFKIGLTTGPADSAREFTVSGNVKGVHAVFQPELHIDSTGRRIKSFLDGTKVAELPKNAVDTTSPGTDTTEP